MMAMGPLHGNSNDGLGFSGFTFLYLTGVMSGNTVLVRWTSETPHRRDAFDVRVFFATLSLG